MQENSSTSSIPTILLSAKADTESRLQGTDSGVSAYLGKPFDERELLSMVTNLLKLKEREREVEKLNQDITEKLLKRYLPPMLVNDFISQKIEITHKPAPRDITLLFANIASFNKVSQQIGAKNIAEILNEYLSGMTETIFQHQGTIDKFVGDQIMVLFGAPQRDNSEVQVERAYKCALQMQEKMIALNSQWQQRRCPNMGLRIGIHYGPAIVGIFGSKQRSDYTAIGPTVNLAATIESLAKPGQILTTSVVRDLLPNDSWRPAGSFSLGEGSEPTPLFEIETKKTKAA